MPRLTHFGIMLFLTALFSLLLAKPVHAQGRPFKLTGVVKDADGLVMPGVVFQIKGTTIGVTSNLNGEYSIDVPNENSTLVVSFLGFVTQEVFIGDQKSIDVALAEDVISIGEVVVVGYGVQKKVSVTGAVSSVDKKDLLKSTSPNLATSLAGRLPGLISTQMAGGQPGKDESTMYLRGAGTTNGTKPLILIDGVPRDNINSLDANEVESVSVLKDASATAVFGVRGANGVILITTKRGEEGKAKLSIRATQSFSSFTKEPERLHSLEYLRLRDEALTNDGLPGVDPNLIAMYENPLLGLDPSDPDYASKAAARKFLYPDNDYYRMVFKKYAPQTTINANVSGGTKRMSYFLNAGYINQGGNYNTEPKSKLGYDPAARMDRWSFRANLDYKLTNSLKAFVNLGSYIQNTGMPGIWWTGNDAGIATNAAFFYTTLMIPTTPGPTTIAGHGAPEDAIVIPLNIDGNMYMAPAPYEVINRFGYYSTVSSNLNSTYGMEWDLGNLVTKGLVLRGMFSYDAISGTNTYGIKWENQYIVSPGTDGTSFTYLKPTEKNYNLSISKDSHSQYKINAQAILSYNRSFGLHDVGGMFVAQRDYWESAGGELPYNVVGIAGRATYSYDSRYFGELNIGYNGSEQFSPDKRYGFFPAASLGWAISNEKWFKENKIIHFLKVRASYGKVGNDQMGTARFLYMDQIKVSGNGYLGSLGQGYRIEEGLMGNYAVTWETAEKYNIGIDFNIIGDITGAVDIFKEHRNDILTLRKSVPLFQGIPLGNIPRVNMGEVDNRGIEFEIGYNKRFNDLFLSVKANIGFNKNEVLFADEVPLSSDYAYQYRQTGYSIGQNFGYEIDWDNNGGYWTKEALNSTNLVYDSGTPRPGDFVYKDLNNDGHINEKDMAPIGNGSVPRRTYGFTVSADYKGFDFSIFFQGLGGYNMAYLGNLVWENAAQGSYFDYHKSAWTEDRWRNGDKITYPALSTGSSTSHAANSFFIQNKSFMRLKNIEIGYTIPNRLVGKLGVTELRIFASGQNLITWSKLKTNHLDPEPDNPMAYPVTKMLNFGASISF